MSNLKLFIGLIGFSSTITLMFSGWSYDWFLGVLGTISFISIVCLMLIEDKKELEVGEK